MPALHTTVSSPVGDLTLVADDGKLTGLYFPHHWYRPDPATFGAFTLTGLQEARRQLAEYFAGDRERFELPLDARGDEFQPRVWDLIRRIGYGPTVSYGALATELRGQVPAKEGAAAAGRHPPCVT